MDLGEHFRLIFASAREVLESNVANLTLDEALFSAGGYRSILGVLKHIGGWAHVYRSYAFDADPRHWDRTSWPRGIRDEVECSKAYVDEVIAWIGEAIRAWDEALANVSQADFEMPRPVHWGETAPLASIVVMVANHLVYHAGELNMLLSIARGEAWEWGEEVEENHIDTFGHGIRGPWMNDEVAKFYEDKLRAAHEERQVAK